MFINLRWFQLCLTLLWALFIFDTKLSVLHLLMSVAWKYDSKCHDPAQLHNAIWSVLGAVRQCQTFHSLNYKWMSHQFHHRYYWVEELCLAEPCLASLGTNWLIGTAGICIFSIGTNTVLHSSRKFTTKARLSKSRVMLLFYNCTS